MADQTQAVAEFQPWRPVMRVAGWAQWLLAASWAAAYGLYGYARLTVGDHEAIVSGNHDPKDLGSGVMTVGAELLHALGMVATILGPFAGVPFAVVTLAGLAFGHRSGPRRAWWSLLAVAATVAVLLAGQTAGTADIRHWMLD